MLLYSADDLPQMESPWQATVETLAYLVEYNKQRISTEEYKDWKAKYSKDYRVKHADEIKASKTEYWYNNKESLSEYRREWRKNNRDKVNAYQRKYRAKYNEEINKKRREYRAKKQLA